MPNGHLFREEPEGISFYVWLTPGSSKNQIVGVVDDGEKTYLKISVNAKAIDNAANNKLVELLSKNFKLAKSRIVMASGQKSRKKKVLLIDANITSILETYQTLLNIK